MREKIPKAYIRKNNKFLLSNIISKVMRIVYELFTCLSSTYFAMYPTDMNNYTDINVKFKDFKVLQCHRFILFVFF